MIVVTAAVMVTIPVATETPPVATARRVPVVEGVAIARAIIVGAVRVVAGRRRRVVIAEALSY
jgi:hypothetical protein